MIKLKKTFIPLVFLALCFQTGSVFAALNLSVISVDGSNSLRLAAAGAHHGDGRRAVPGLSAGY
jgi:hypothetical protein